MLGFAVRQFFVARWFARSKKHFFSPFITLVLKSHSIRRLSNARIFVGYGRFCDARWPSSHRNRCEASA
jgi:hypothetical protein